MTRPQSTGANSRHWGLNVLPGVLVVLVVFGVIRTPFDSLFRTASLSNLALGMSLFFGSSLLHAAYKFDEARAFADGSFSEWTYIPRSRVEQIGVVICWIIGIANLASCITEFSRSLS